MHMSCTMWHPQCSETGLSCTKRRHHCDRGMCPARNCLCRAHNLLMTTCRWHHSSCDPADSPCTNKFHDRARRICHASTACTCRWIPQQIHPTCNPWRNQFGQLLRPKVSMCRQGIACTAPGRCWSSCQCRNCCRKAAPASAGMYLQRMRCTMVHLGQRCNSQSCILHKSWRPQCSEICRADRQHTRSQL